MNSPDRPATQPSFTDLVRGGYDRVAETYAAQRDTTANLPFLERFTEALPAAGKVLDLGCGAGIVSELLIAKGFEVIGIDISPKQIEMARQLNLAATLQVRDMQDLKHGEFHVDGVISLYAIFHLPRESHRRLFQVIRTFMEPGGCLLVTMGEEAWEGVEPDYLGTEMYWSNYGRVENRALIEGAGFGILLDEIDPSAGERHQVVLGIAR